MVSLYGVSKMPSSRSSKTVESRQESRIGECVEMMNCDSSLTSSSIIMSIAMTLDGDSAASGSSSI